MMTGIWIFLLTLLVLAGLAILLLALFHVRYRAAWMGEWNDLASRQEGEIRVEYGFPGFMKTWGREGPTTPETNGFESRSASPSPPQNPFATAGSHNRPPGARDHQAQTATIPEPPAARNAPSPDRDSVPRAPLQEGSGSHARQSSPKTSQAKAQTSSSRRQHALFSLATDGKAWKHLAGYGFRLLRLTRGLLRPRIAMTAGHPDPALLGSLIGRWHAVSPLLPLPETTFNGSFQDRLPTFRIRVEGGFSALSLLCFAAAAAGTFPYFGLGRRVWRSWRQPDLTGWRAWVHRRLRSL